MRRGAGSAIGYLTVAELEMWIASTYQDFTTGVGDSNLGGGGWICSRRKTEVVVLTRLTPTYQSVSLGTPRL